MTINFTKRRDGNLRVTMRPALHIGYDDIANGIYDTISCGEPLPTSRRAALDAACEYIYKYGRYHIDDNIDAEYFAKAEEHAKKLFPELVDSCHTM